MDIIKLEQICLKAGKRYILKNIDWTVRQGEHWALFGMNGCGKTTLLSIIGGYKVPTGGSMQVLGQRYNDETILPIRQKIAFVSSSFFDRYYRLESPREIIAAAKFGAFGINGLVSNEAQHQVQAALKFMGLGQKGDQPYMQLSKGERQSVLLARAFYMNAELLLLDEPCSGLDMVARKRILSLIEKLCEHKRMTIIYVTHYPEEIMPKFKQILMLKRGRGYFAGDRETGLSTENLRQFLAAEESAGGL